MPAPVGTYLVGGPILDTTGALITPTEELYRFGAISLREGIPHRVERFGEVGNYTYRWVPAILLDDTMQANATSRVGLSEAFKTQLAELGASQFHTFGWALDRIYRSEDFFGPDGSAREIVGMEAFDGIPVAIDSTGRIGRFGGTIIEPSNIDVLANHVILAMAKNAIYGFISTETHAFEYTIDATTGAWTSVAPNGVQANAIVDMSIPPGVTSSIWLLQVREGQDDLRIQNFSLNNGRLGGVDFGLTWALADAQAAYPDLPLTSLTQVQALAASGTLAGDTVLVYCRTDDHAFTMSFLVTGVTPNITLTARPAESHRIGYVDHLSGATLLASHEFVSTQYVVRPIRPAAVGSRHAVPRRTQLLSRGLCAG